MGYVLPGEPHYFDRIPNLEIYGVYAYNIT
jgi:hypothetical protein